MGEILFLTHRVPWPPNRGDKIRSHNILRKLMHYGPVHLACFADDQAERDCVSQIRDDLASLKIVQRRKPRWQAGLQALATHKPVSLTSFHSDEIAAFVERTLSSRPIDCIFIFSGQMAQYIPDDFRGRVIMDFADVDSAKFESYGASASGPMAWINRREGRLLRKFEATVARRADYSLFVSDVEAQLFRQRSGVDGGKIKAIGNGIDLAFYDSSKAVAEIRQDNSPLLIFTGQMDYLPNIEAVISFSQEVMPLVRKQFPQVQFAIVGRAPTLAVANLSGQHGTVVVGSVDDIRSWILAADIVVAPLRMARGIQNKVLEAMALGKPVVASVAAAEGIDAVDGRDLMVARNIEDEARLICELLADRMKMARVGDNAKALIHSHYSWEQQLAELPVVCGVHEVKVTEARL